MNRGEGFVLSYNNNNNNNTYIYNARNDALNAPNIEWTAFSIYMYNVDSRTLRLEDSY